MKPAIKSGIAIASKLATAQFGETTGVIGPTALITISADVTPAEKYS
jgi:hypothetical protein